MRAPLEREQIMEIRINLYEQTGKLDVLTGREKAEMLVSAYRNRMNYVKSGDKIVCDFEYSHSDDIIFKPVIFRFKKNDRRASVCGAY